MKQSRLSVMILLRRYPIYNLQALFWIIRGLTKYVVGTQWNHSVCASKCLTTSSEVWGAGLLCNTCWLTWAKSFHDSQFQDTMPLNAEMGKDSLNKFLQTSSSTPLNLQHTHTLPPIQGLLNQGFTIWSIFHFQQAYCRWVWCTPEKGVRTFS